MRTLLNKNTWILTGFILLKIILEYALMSPEYDLQRDEYLHLDQANHLAWGYLSVPPLTSWISLLIRLLGNGVFWVKFFPALFGAMTLWLVWKAVGILKGNLFARTLAVTCLLFSVLLRLNMLYQPNSLDVLCWTAVYYILLKYISSRNENWFFAAAVVFAIGFLNKYNIVFLIIGLAPAILLSEHRKIFLRKKLWLAVGLGLLLILPNLVWQYNNHFPVIHHMKELSDTQLVNVSRSAFLKSQVFFFMGSIVVLLAGYAALLFYAPFSTHRFFFFSLVITLAVFIILRAKDYYAIGIHPIYLAFGTVFLADMLRSGWKRWLRPVLFLVPLSVFIPMYQYAFPDKSPAYIVSHHEQYSEMDMLHWEDGKEHAMPQDFADMLGWKELAGKVDKVYRKAAATGNTIVLCDNYGQAGAINYYTKEHINAVSFNADYVNWFHLGKPYLNLIRVKEASGSLTEFDQTSPHFQSAVIADSITNPYAREYKTTIFSFTGSKVDINVRLRQELEKAKKGDQ